MIPKKDVYQITGTLQKFFSLPDDLQIMLEQDLIEEDKISKEMLQMMLKLNSWFINEDNEARSLLLFNIEVQYQFFGIKIWVLCLKNHQLNLAIEIHGIRRLGNISKDSLEDMDRQLLLLIWSKNIHQEKVIWDSNIKWLLNI